MSTIITILLSTGCTKTTEDSALEDTACEDMGTWYLDGDEDGFGAEAVEACIQPEGSVDDNSDCDDNDSDTFPGANEICNGEDDNCDGEVDEATAVDAETWYPDLDGDGYGDSSAGEPACEAPSGFIADGTDCDDALAAVNPGAIEICNGLDDDCNPETPEAGMAHFVDTATGTMTDMSTALAGSEGSPALAEFFEAGELTLCEGDWYVGLDIQADLAVLGVGDPAAIVLNGGGTDTQLMTITGEGLDVAVRGLGMTNGLNGAIYCGGEESLLNMRDVSVWGFGSSASGYGSAISTEGCDTELQSVELFENEGWYYAAMLGYFGDHSWTDVEIYDNYAAGDVGGALTVYGEVVFDEVNFSNNSTDGWVGGYAHIEGSLEWTGSATTSSGLQGNTDIGYGAVYLDSVAASFDTVDFGTSEGGDDNGPVDIWLNDLQLPYMAGDDASFECDSEGCGSADSYELSSATYPSAIGDDAALANVFLADESGLTIQMPSFYGYADSGCYVDWFIATNTSFTTGEWEVVALDSYNSTGTSPEWTEGRGGVISEAGLYYALGFATRSCSSGGFTFWYDENSSVDAGFGEGVGWVGDYTYSSGSLDVSVAQSDYIAPFASRVSVTEL